MLSSRWPRSPSHGKCSKRFYGSSRSYGRSRHQRRRETFDVMHSRATDRRSASKCQGKWPDQILDQAFGLPEVLVAVSTSRLSCKRAGKTRTLMSVWDSSGESRMIKIAVKKIVAAMGYEIRQAVKIDYRFVPRQEDKFKWLQALNIRTILDIGANTGQFASEFRSILPEA